VHRKTARTSSALRTCNVGQIRGAALDAIGRFSRWPANCVFDGAASVAFLLHVQFWIPASPPHYLLCQLLVMISLFYRSNKAEQSVFLLSEPCCEIKPMMEKEQ
jgi:hypothetical protein